MQSNSIWTSSSIVPTKNKDSPLGTDPYVWERKHLSFRTPPPPPPPSRGLHDRSMIFSALESLRFLFDHQRRACKCKLDPALACMHMSELREVNGQESNANATFTLIGQTSHSKQQTQHAKATFALTGQRSHSKQPQRSHSCSRKLPPPVIFGSLSNRIDPMVWKSMFYDNVGSLHLVQIGKRLYYLPVGLELWLSLTCSEGVTLSLWGACKMHVRLSDYIFFISHLRQDGKLFCNICKEQENEGSTDSTPFEHSLYSTKDSLRNIVWVSGRSRSIGWDTRVSETWNQWDVSACTVRKHVLLSTISSALSLNMLYSSLILCLNKPVIKTTFPVKALRKVKRFSSKPIRISEVQTWI